MISPVGIGVSAILAFELICKEIFCVFYGISRISIVMVATSLQKYPCKRKTCRDRMFLIIGFLEEEHALYPIDEDTAEITHESNPGNLLQVPAKGDALQAHNHDTSSGADDEH